MQSPQISVLLSIYNTAPWLRAALDSVLSQTLTDLEVICVNDGSTDNSAGILNEYAQKDSRLHVLYQENAGQSAARNKAAAAASGKWLYFMDSDDTLVPDALEALYAYGMKHDLDMVFMNTHVFADTPEWEELTVLDYNRYYRVNHTYPDVYDGFGYFRRIKENNEFVAPAWTYLIRRDFIQKNDLRFYEGIQREDDLFQITSLCHAKRVGHVDRKLVNHRIRSGSIITQARKLQYAYSDMIVAMELCRLAGSCAPDEETYLQILDNARATYMLAAQDYASLSPEEQAKVSTLPPELRMQFEVFLLSPYGAVNCHNALVELDNANRENIRLQTTLSYRLGSLLTSVPRKLRDLIKR